MPSAPPSRLGPPPSPLQLQTCNPLTYNPLCCSKIGPALMAGNTLVLKPPTQGSVAGLLMVQCFAAAGIPPGVINCVTGEPTASRTSRLCAELCHAVPRCAVLCLAVLCLAVLCRAVPDHLLKQRLMPCRLVCMATSLLPGTASLQPNPSLRTRTPPCRAGQRDWRLPDHPPPGQRHFLHWGRHRHRHLPQGRHGTHPGMVWLLASPAPA